MRLINHAKIQSQAYLRCVLDANRPQISRRPYRFATRRTLSRSFETIGAGEWCGLAQLEAASPNIDQAVKRVEATFTAAAEDVSAQAAVVDALRDTVDTMSNAIASIAAVR